MTHISSANMNPLGIFKGLTQDDVTRLGQTALQIKTFCSKTVSATRSFFSKIGHCISSTLYTLKNRVSHSFTNAKLQVMRGIHNHEELARPDHRFNNYNFHTYPDLIKIPEL